MKKFHSLFNLVKSYKIVSLILVITLVGVVSAFSLVGGNGAVETVSIQSTDLVRRVKVSGKVAPRERVDLGFEISGIIAKVNKSVGSRVSRGEVIVSLDTGSITAEIARAEAELSSAQAELNKIEGTEVFENSVNNAKRSIAQSINNAYIVASDAIQNKSDPLFLYPRGAYPKLTGSFQGYNDLRESIQKQRVDIGYRLDEWRELISGVNGAYSEEQLKLSKQYLAEVSKFISDLSRAVNMFEETTYMSQTQIDSHKAAMLAARTSLNTAMQSFIDNENTLAKLLSDVPVQLSRVEAARASVLNLRYQMRKSSLVSPIDGLVALMEAKVGQAISVGTQLVSVITEENIIETYVPEVLIAGIEIGNTASITLDAYGSGNTFIANVVHIDPAETIRDGVSTYKVKLAFDKLDSRVRSGMTANIEIETFRKIDSKLIPERAVLRKDGIAFVYVLTEGGEEKVRVEVGERDSQGNIEIIAGIDQDDQVLLNPPK